MKQPIIFLIGEVSITESTYTQRIINMTSSNDNKRLRQLFHRITIKREDLARLKTELSALQEERKALKEKIDAEAAESTS
ncbi:hypothetical protein [Paracoccus saliphilus]|uniref:Uncharacterized protein n=2 Tax=Paracoccus saliphilus TaxID=405559 RepID=A0ABY7SES9_9RHOB|nr:hypothetical protein [Paracoccus saliphilus]WCR05540.1 hypothetical protein JHX88_22035 [Paracoccus saliphilus]